MNTELIRVEVPRPADDGVGRLAATKALLQERPYLGLLAAPAVVAAAPAVVIVGTAAAAVVTTGAFEVNRRWRQQDSGLTALPFSEAVGRVDVAGAPLRPGRVYARHPKPGRADRLILARDLHATIVREQIAEIITYMRSRLHLSSLKVSVRSSQTGRVFAGGTLKAVPLTAKITGRREEAYAVEWSSHRPLRLEVEDELVWIDDFPEIKAAAKNARHGKMKVSQSTDLSFDIEAGAARVARIDSGWLSNFEFIVEAEFE